MGEAPLVGKLDVIEADPFAADPIQRDQYGRPLIIPVKKRGGQPDLKAKLVGYTRVSTFAGSISDAQGLIGWRLRHLALGLGRNEELAAMAGVFGPTLNDCSRFDKAELDRIVETAHSRSGGNIKADHGTAVHGMTEPDRDPFVPARMTADVESYHKALADHGIEVVSTEQFVVCDELQVAGTFDHLYRLTRTISLTDVDALPAGMLVIGDKKTGALHFDSQSIQLAVYGRGRLYDPETGERTTHGASDRYGLLVHIPKGEGRTDIYLIDLKKGWAAAQLAGKVRAHRADKTLGQPFPEPDRHVVPIVIPPQAEVSDPFIWALPKRPVDSWSMIEAAPGVLTPVIHAQLPVPAVDLDPHGTRPLTDDEIEMLGRLDPFGSPVTPDEPENPAVVESAPAAPVSAGIAESLQTQAAGQRRDIAAECAATEAAIKARREEVATAEPAPVDRWTPPAARDAADKDRQQTREAADEAAAALSNIGAVPVVVPILQRLNEATSRDELAQVWHDAKAQGLEWTAAHTDVLQSRAKTIAEAGTS